MTVVSSYRKKQKEESWQTHAKFNGCNKCGRSIAEKCGVEEGTYNAAIVE